LQKTLEAFFHQKQSQSLEKIKCSACESKGQLIVSRLFSQLPHIFLIHVNRCSKKEFNIEIPRYLALEHLTDKSSSGKRVVSLGDETQNPKGNMNDCRSMALMYVDGIFDGLSSWITNKFKFPTPQKIPPAWSNTAGAAAANQEPSSVNLLSDDESTFEESKTTSAAEQLSNEIEEEEKENNCRCRTTVRRNRER
jgi:hypothetical protein